MMKSDVLDGFETVKACIAYKVNGEETTEFPFEINEGIEPVYVEMPGWNVDMTKMQSEDEFPEEFNAYISFLEEELEVPIKIVSVGPDREQTIVRYTEEIKPENNTKWQKTTSRKDDLLPFLFLADFLSFMI